MVMGHTEAPPDAAMRGCGAHMAELGECARARVAELASSMPNLGMDGARPNSAKKLPIGVR